MKHAVNKDVQEFLEGLKTADEDSFTSLSEIRDIILEVHPATTEKMMYGGIVFFLGNEMHSGVFANKKHISIEFSKGFLMEDPEGHLEGKGKYRRHLKIRMREDIAGKKVPFYVVQAV